MEFIQLQKSLKIPCNFIKLNSSDAQMFLKSLEDNHPDHSGCWKWLNWIFCFIPEEEAWQMKVKSIVHQTGWGRPRWVKTWLNWEEDANSIPRSRNRAVQWKCRWTWSQYSLIQLKYFVFIYSSFLSSQSPSSRLRSMHVPFFLHLSTF